MHHALSNQGDSLAPSCPPQGQSAFEFANFTDAEAALKELNGKEVGGVKLSIAMAAQMAPPPQMAPPMPWQHGAPPPPLPPYGMGQLPPQAAPPPPPLGSAWMGLRVAADPGTQTASCWSLRLVSFWHGPISLPWRSEQNLLHPLRLNSCRCSCCLQGFGRPPMRPPPGFYPGNTQGPSFPPVRWAR